MTVSDEVFSAVSYLAYPREQAVVAVIPENDMGLIGVGGKRQINLNPFASKPPAALFGIAPSRSTVDARIGLYLSAVLENVSDLPRSWPKL